MTKKPKNKSTDEVTTGAKPPVPIPEVEQPQVERAAKQKEQPLRKNRRSTPIAVDGKVPPPVGKCTVAGKFTDGKVETPSG